MTSRPTAPSPPLPPRFCVVLPMYNEGANARACIGAIDTLLSGLDLGAAIIAVDDGSSDDTWSVLQDLATVTPSLRLCRHGTNQGYGAANRTGFAAAIAGGFDYALVMDADGTQDPQFIRGFLPHMRQGVDFIKATRYARGSRVEGVDIRRKAISWLGNRVAKAALRIPLTDFTNGFRAIRGELLKKLTTHDNGFSVLMEEVVQARRLGASFAEVPYTLTVRRAPGSTSKFTYSFAVYRNYLRYLFRPRG
ncbi:hypothetical protein THSYN_28780 [Candidatus Thiodictyon syntrophicum]|uniref:Glycosyltransferase 2-like domain-containing protein n=2 Tax=Candidatus Thiodictyon syntrophicum TaxID=1166950 RepID=A0A2K8UG79_9GAMM|nr:glycosyltransferase [Candidatus Thiodictyon syntrophicum]AUB84532.1 hypothetical protein THSYN_28780 [Candidatus Thiodictyon syntrophicum]